MNEKTILIADDSRALTESLKLAVNYQYPNISVQVASTKEEVEASMNESESIDLVLLDIQFLSNEYDGIEIARWLKKNFSETKILMMSQYVKSEYKTLLINDVGVNGYLDKQSSLELFLDSIKRVLSGETVIDRHVVYATQGAKKYKISRREKDVLELLEVGESQKTIANKLFISPRTVEGHVRNLRDRFELRTTAELLVFYTKYKTSFREDGRGSDAPFLS